MSVKIEIINSSSRSNLPKIEIKRKLENAISKEGVNSGNVVVIYVDDDYITRLNRKYLNHNYATDVLSFLLDENILDGEIYISVETATRQAAEYKVKIKTEIERLAIHGALHLIGYNDDTPEAKDNMTRLEDLYLNFKT